MDAGKTITDCLHEVGTEAPAFFRWYAELADKTFGKIAPTGDDAMALIIKEPAGVAGAILPWNFPFLMAVWKIAPALAAGCSIVVKPAEQTPLIAHVAVRLMHRAGVPDTACQLLPGAGQVGAALTSDARVGGVAFTGSTDTALKIRGAMVKHLAPGAPLIAETGGMNAMIVDSTALPEQAVQAIVESAFQSAGQRCSALRCLYVQEDIAEGFTEMLTGAMDALHVGHPWHLSTDCGPVIDEEARAGISEHIQQARADGRLLHELKTPNSGTYIAPTLIKVGGIEDIEREIFGPVLHLATFKSRNLDRVIGAINATGYGLTFGDLVRWTFYKARRHAGCATHSKADATTLCK